MKGRKNRKEKGFDFKKFFTKFAIRFAYRVMELGLLLLTGWALGLKLVRY